MAIAKGESILDPVVRKGTKINECYFQKKNQCETLGNISTINPKLALREHRAVLPSSAPCAGSVFLSLQVHVCDCLSRHRCVGPKAEPHQLHPILQSRLCRMHPARPSATPVSPQPCSTCLGPPPSSATTRFSLDFLLHSIPALTSALLSSFLTFIPSQATLT